jgi:hypothetical protein
MLMTTLCPSLATCCQNPFEYAIPGTPYPPIPGGEPVVTNATIDVPASTHMSYQISATNSPTVYGASGLPAGLLLNASTGIISGTITSASLITYDVEITATNEFGTGTGTLTINVVEDAPVVSNGSITVAPSGAVNYQIVATNSPTSYGSGTLPGTLVLNTSTGLITGNVPATAPTTYTIPISATNATGTGNNTLTIKVHAAVTFNFASSGGFSSVTYEIAIDGGAYGPLSLGTNYTPNSQLKFKSILTAPWTPISGFNELVGTITTSGSPTASAGSQLGNSGNVTVVGSQAYMEYNRGPVILNADGSNNVGNVTSVLGAFNFVTSLVGQVFVNADLFVHAYNQPNAGTIASGTMETILNF